ncbi:protein PHYTOCHROME KINASE SUBSTRATE 4 [Diospyros lotus]|uniref:protein PHYTOCHROME KINASE SUBSTRATE 4 n=1 Tax=Diospyros lotus TaxID=55363 RepID=UPI00225767D5|nr:protein PHYTOCHROME KINASE SUBSTRATE 4 [Diospyros lotus]
MERPVYRPFAEKNLNKDASFSSYLRPETAAAAQEDAGCMADDSDQISVFDAENYFSETNEKKSKRSGISSVNLDGFSMVSRPSSASSFDGYGRNFRPHSFHATPTASSEASWNSQTGLLSNPPGAIAVSLRDHPGDRQKIKGGSRLAVTWFSRRRCPCSGKKSVEVEEKIAETSRSPSVSHSRKQSQSQKHSEVVDRPEKIVPNLRRISSSQSPFPSGISHQNGFSFPILDQSSKMVKKAINPIASPEDPPRESLEVFQPPSMEVQALDRRAFGFPVSPMSRVTATDDDVASDASSDLFEIESFSTQPSSSNPLFRRRDSLDEAATFNPRKLAASALSRDSLDEPATPSVAATECYEPSEASIDWSVTTAEGFDRASYITNLSDMEDYSTITRRQHAKTTSAATTRRSSTGSGGLLSCRCEKAVSVGPQPVKCAQHDGGRAAAGPQRAVGGGGKPPLGGPQCAARMSLAFAT